MISSAYRLLLLLIAVFLFMACKQEKLPCAQPTTMSVILGCYQVLGDTGNNVPVIVDTFLQHPVTITYNAANNSRAYNYTQTGVHTLIINMSPVSDSCSWMITPDTGAALRFDTLTFYYQRQLHFLSNECGYAYYYNLDSVNTTHNSIDSVKISNASITSNVNTEHLKIFFRRH